MCSIAAAGLALSAFGTIAKFQAQQQQAQAVRDTANFNAQVAANNAITARQQSVQAHDIGKVEAAKAGLKARQLISLQRASSAGQGVLVGQGSAADITADTQAQARVDVGTTRSNAARESLGFITRGTNFDAQQGLILATGSNQASAINTQAQTTLLSGATSVASKWQTYKKTTGGSIF